MRIVVSILAILFGLVHGAAAVTQFKSPDFASRGSAIMMACGGLAVVVAAILHIIGLDEGTAMGWAAALEVLVGCVLICFAAYLNGKRAQKFNPKHHMIRACIATMLAVSFIVW